MARRKKQNEDQPDNQDNINSESDDTFGLPEIEYEPINRDQPDPEPVKEEEEVRHSEFTIQEEATRDEPAEQGYTPTYFDDDDEPSAWPKILGIAALILIAGGAFWFFGIYQPKQKAAAEKIRLEQEAKDIEAARLERERLAEERRLADEQRRADSLATAKPAEGMVEALTERTGRYYVVIASAIDDDLIMDYAKDLSKKGVSTKIIPPFRKTKFSRLAIDSKDTYAEAQATADGLKGGDYGNEIWVVKY